MEEVSKASRSARHFKPKLKQEYPKILNFVGAYGEVRKCLHKETKALRAVKIINKKFLEEDEKDKL